MSRGADARPAGRREWLGLAVLGLPAMLYAMDLTALDLALPRISAALHPTAAQLLWIVDIYGFMLAGMLITMGTLGDRIGRRRLLLVGAAAFGAGSVLAALSTTAEMLIATRALLGVAGATLAPSTLSLIRAMFHDARQRTFAIGFWVTSGSAGAVLGPLVGGLVIDRFGWGSVFLVGVPVMVLLLVLGPVLLPEFRDPAAGRIDVPSAALSLASVLSVIFGLKELAQAGPAVLPSVTIAVGLGLGLAFVQRQRALVEPLIDLRLFRGRVFSVALGTYGLGTFVVFGIFLFIAQYLQLALGLSPWQAGLATVPAFGTFVAGGMLAPWLVRMARPESVLVLGLLVAASGLLLLTQVSAGLALLVVGSVVVALGMAPVFTLATDLVVGAAPPERAGAAAAISETSSELGGALGIALLGSFGTAIYGPGAAFTEGFGLAALACCGIALALASLAAVLLRADPRARSVAVATNA